MVKKRETILVVLSILFLGLILGQGLANAQKSKAPVGELKKIPEVTIEALSKGPEMYVDKEVVIRGKLILVGDYWRDGKFLIEDARGNRFPVTTWRALSVTPIYLGEGKVSVGDPKRVMSYYLNKDLLIRGKVMAKRDKIMPRIEGEYYLKVEEAKEIRDR